MSSRPPYPPTSRGDEVEILHGDSIPDPYRWLEQGGDPRTQAWTASQNALTESLLAAVPGRARLRARLDELLSIGALSTPEPVAGRYFYQRRDGRQNQPVLYVREGRDGEDRVLIDPNQLDAQGTTALDWFYPSEDGRLLAYGLSENGSEQSVLHVLEVDSGAPLPDRIPRTRSADLAWLPDGSGFYYTRYPASGEVPDGEEHYHRSVFFHRLGADAAGDPLIFRPAEKEHWPGVGLSPDGRWLRDRRRPHVRSDRPLPAGPRGGNAAGAGRPGSAGDLRRRGRPRPAVPAHQPRRTDLPALSGRSGAARPGGLAGDRAAASGCRARRVPDHRLRRWR